jgi:hypothetical protein
MNFTIIDAEQRSPEWFTARAGRATGSKAHCILAIGRSGAEAVTKRDYRLQLACEVLTGRPAEGGYVNYDMQRGIDLEPAALGAYEAATGEMVRQTGFLASDDLQVGCSLDGDIAEFKGILELKAPKTNTHIGYWRDRNTFLTDYMPQVLHNLWVSGASWCDLVSYDDRLPAQLQLLRVRVERDQAEIDKYAKHVERFLAEVNLEVRAIQELMKKEAA